MRLKDLKDSFEKFLGESILCLGEKNRLREACAYALQGEGKRIRPLVVLMVGRALGHGLDVFHASLCVEYFHTASLIADDLPCMDNDDYRRSRPALHKVFGQSVALLASYALISAGYEKIFTGVKVLSNEKPPFSKRANEVCVLALDAATRCAGISGATGGQFQDLFIKNPSLEEIVEVMYKKTVTLFEVSFVLGWLFGGGDLSSVGLIRDVAYHFGLAFQIADDLGDIKQDSKDSMNIALLLGRDGAFKMLEKEIDCFLSKMKKMGILTSDFEQVVELLIASCKIND